tara:strand:+ start:489 stop:854 length:366 start_codon:yes stop_codon:yes gene_type:complete
MYSTKIIFSTFVRNLRRAGCALLGCSALIFVVLLAFVASLDYAAVRRNQVGAGWRYASDEELKTALIGCGIHEPSIIRAGFIFKFGWAWDSFPNDREIKSRCLDRALKKIGATAAIYDAMG